MELPWSFGSPPSLLAEQVLCVHLLVALGIGIMLGYERSYKGHAAGMRTYALVCMAAAGVVSVSGTPQVIQGIVTGIGFLGGGVIMKDGMSVRGMSSAALIWTVSAIGILVGMGFYGGAVLMALICFGVMSGVKRLEKALPHHNQIRLVLAFDRHHVMTAEALRVFTTQFGYQMMAFACQTEAKDGNFEYDLVLQSSKADAFNGLMDGLAKTENLVEFRVTPIQD